MDLRHVGLVHESVCLSLLCAFVFFPSFSFVSVVYVSVVVICRPFRVSVRQAGDGGVCVCVYVCGAEAVHPHTQTHTDRVGASSVTGSGRCSTAARCRATWSVGSA